jgi:hypothetical protein
MLTVIKRLRTSPDELKQQALKAADAIAVRWDVPQGQRYPGQPADDKELYIEVEPNVWAIWPHDMRDTRPRLRLTAPDPETGEQGRVSGRLLPDDLLFGIPSSAIPVLLALVPVAAMVLLVGSYLGPMGYGIGLLVMGALLAIVSNATSNSWWVAAGITACLPLLKGVNPWSSLSSLPGGTWAASGVSLAVVGLIVGLALLFAGKREARMAIGAMLLLVLTLVAAVHVPEFLQPFVLSLPACALPWTWSYWLERTRTVELSVYGAACNWESQDKGLGHVKVRQAQTLRAAKGYSK